MNITDSPTSTPFDLDERHAANLAEFTEALGQSRFWQLLTKDENDTHNATGLFDTQTGLIFPPATQLRVFLDRHPFAFVLTLKNTQHLATLQSSTLLLWNNDTSKISYNVKDAKQVVKQGHWAGIEGWQLPNKEKLWAFATHTNNPHRKGQEYRLSCLRKRPTEIPSEGIEALAGLASLFAAMATEDGVYNWLTKVGCYDVDRGCWGLSETVGYIFACNATWESVSDDVILADIATFGWLLVAPSGEAFQPDQRWQTLSHDMLLATLVTERLRLKVNNSTVTLDPSKYWLDNQLVNLDYTPCRLPKLDNAQLTDPEKGLWELWGEEHATLKRFGLVAHDPGRDVKQRAVSIDFGTSSTVVAMDTSSGGRELLRIGVRDFYQTVQAQHFENPTVLEVLDFCAFQAAWTARAYRPALDWRWMRAAHEAQASFRDNPGDTRVLASILPRLKQWALRAERRRIRVTDLQGLEIELEQHSERNPVRGQPLTVASQDPFDPIELYAWYLGMAINLRVRGLFLKYYLSFPVEYPREVKNRVLASFRRGLQRSLPDSLIQHYPQLLNDFEVTDLASEPAAYAAAALPQLKIEPNDQGVPYAVFDFGGGTTDFDFGLMRNTTPEEEEQDASELAFEHLASGGDNYLGGENLLEQLVFTSFVHNLNVLREKRIQFVQPLNTDSFAGSEAFLARTQAAQTNNVMLAAKLRPFLEGDTAELTAQIKLDLIDTDGNKKPCELVLDAQALDGLLAKRMTDGVRAFLAELARLSPVLPNGAPIHVLLAGNGSHSRHITALFNTEGELWRALLTDAFGESPPEITVHPPLPMDESNPHAPTAKTGVALGLLRLAPGNNVLLIDRLHELHDGQAPFAWFAGRLRRGHFEPTIIPGVAYGQWHDMGPLQKGVFNLFVTTSPRARQNPGLPEGDRELKKHRLDYPAAADGARLFARAASPFLLELTTAQDRSALESCTVKPLMLE